MSLSQRAEQGSDPPSPWVLAQAWVHLLVQEGFLLLPQAGVTTAATSLVVGGGLLGTIVGVAAVVAATTRQTALGSVQQQLRVRVRAGRGASKQGCSVRLCSGRLLAASAGCPASVVPTPVQAHGLHAATMRKPYCLRTHTPFQCPDREVCDTLWSCATSEMQGSKPDRLTHLHSQGDEEAK